MAVNGSMNIQDAKMLFTGLYKLYYIWKITWYREGGGSIPHSGGKIFIAIFQFNISRNLVFSFIVIIYWKCVSSCCVFRASFT